MDPLQANEVSAGSRGEIRFTDEARLVQLRGSAVAASLLLVEVPPLGHAARGQLGEYLEAAVEDALARRGAAPPGVGASSDWDASLSDQLYRARHVGARGLVLALGSLHAITSSGGVLEPEDSATLAFWARATVERPVVLLLGEENRSVHGYRAPVRLSELLSLPEDAPLSASTPSEPAVTVAVAVAVAASSSASAVGAANVATAPPPPVAAADAPPWVDDGEWRKHAEELVAARGPKPLAQVERLFVSRYVPLAEAEIRGVTDAAARAVRADWAASFAKSYGEAFAALRVTGKRPTMVFDVPQVASRIARLHGARSIELLLVDGMRFDLGQRMHDRLRVMLEGKAACAERMLLWSALPSTTATQLDLLAHGLEGLSRPLREEMDASPVTRGRSATALRRMRVGARDLLKLDVVEARFREHGPRLPDRLDAVAGEVAQAVARHADSLADRTLLVVFGDHGFVCEPEGDGSAPATQGGASPEEALVPGFAWLVGGVH